MKFLEISFDGSINVHDTQTVLYLIIKFKNMFNNCYSNKNLPVGFHKFNSYSVFL